jgi:2-hydroxy-6-oxonona-2,4-dienedioate hydrolase
MTAGMTLTLDDNDPRVVAARQAEQRLFDCYGLDAEVRHVRLPRWGIRVRVTEVGSGDPVVMVPGNTGDGFPLAPLMAELTGRRVITINRPGGGLSEGMDHWKVDFRELAVQTLSCVLDALALERVPIIAHSIGGHWSLWFAMDRPERVAALALLGVPGNVVSTGPPFALRLLSVPVLNRLLFALVTPRTTSRSLRALSFLGHSADTLSRLPEAMAECYLRFQNLPHYRISSLSLMRRVSRLSGPRPGIRITAEQLGTVRQPTMFLWGTNDPFGSADTGRRVASNLPSARFHAIPGGGHLPWLDDPAGCGRLILDFLSERKSTRLRSEQ